MTKKIKRIVIGIGSGVGLAVVGLLLSMHVRASGTTALIIVSDPTQVRPRGYCLLNPFRDAGPEVASEEVLSRLRSGDRTVLVTLLGSREQADREFILAREAQYPIEGWRVGNRDDHAGVSEVMYWVTRGGGYSDEGYEESVWVRADRSSGQWVVQAYSAVY